MSKAFEVYSKLFQLFNEKLLNVLIESRHTILEYIALPHKLPASVQYSNSYEIRKKRPSTDI